MANGSYNGVDTPVGLQDPYENAESTMQETGGMPEVEGQTHPEPTIQMDEADREEETEEEDLGSLPPDANLAEYMDDVQLSSIATELIGFVEDDLTSRKEWEKMYEEGMSLLGLTYEERSDPFEGATGVTHPLLNEAITQFQAQAYKELLPAGGPARTQIIGKVTPEREAQAERVKTFLNYMITQEMQEFDPEYDQMLYYVGYGGSAFKKTYYDEQMARVTSPYILPRDLLVNYSARDLQTAERVTHILRYSPNDIKKLMVSGFYRDVDLGTPGEIERDDIQEKIDRIKGLEPTSSDEEYVIYECHCNLNLDGLEDKDEDGEPTGIKLPYIVTFHPDSREVLSIRRNWNEGDPRKAKIEYFTHYKFLPGLGFYGFGMVHVLGNLSRTSTSILRQLIDAGTLSNLPAGFKARGLRIEDQTPIQPGEWRDVDAPGGDLAANLLPLPYKEPSATLLQLLGLVVDSAQKFVGTTDLGTGDSNTEMPVGTAIAMLERGSRVISAVHKRLHYAQKQELQLIARVVAKYMPPVYPYEVPGASQTAMKADFDDTIDVLPVSDPNIFSMTQRITLAQQQLQLAQQAPQMHNMYEAYRRMYSALGVTDIDLVLPPPKQPEPEDALLENARSLVIPTGGNPLKAFPDQDHLAHIQTHIQFMKLPLLMTSPAVYGVLMSHVLEHASLAAQQAVVIKLHQMTNGQIPRLTEEQMANEVSKEQVQIMQMISQQLMPPPPNPGGDPLIQIQQQNLQLKAQDMQQRQQNEQQKLAFDQHKLAVKQNEQQQRLQSQEDIAQMRSNVSLQRARM
jgi:hypothetical protein